MMVVLSGRRDTTLGTSLSPSSPSITSGFVRFIHATRLLVVPRSMPTTLSWFSNSIWNMGGFIDQIRHVLAPVEQCPHFAQRKAVVRSVPRGKLHSQFAIDFIPHVFKSQAR